VGTSKLLGSFRVAERFTKKSIFSGALAGTVLMLGPAQAQTLQQSFLSASQLIASGGATGSFCTEFPSGSGTFLVAVAFTGSDTFVSTTGCDPNTFTSTIGSAGSGLASDFRNIADFLLNGFQNIDDVRGAVQAHLDQTAAPGAPGNFPDLQNGAIGDEPPANENNAQPTSPQESKEIRQLRDEIAELERQADELEDENFKRLKDIDDLSDNKDHPTNVKIRELEQRVNQIKASDAGHAGLLKELENARTFREVDIDQQNELYDADQADIDDLERNIREKQDRLNKLLNQDKVSSLSGPRTILGQAKTVNAMAKGSAGNGPRSTVLTPLFSQSNRQGFLLDLDALFRHGQAAGTMRPSPWDFWLQGAVTLFDDDQAADRDGQFLQLIAGSSYRVNKRFILGGLLTYNNGNVTSNALNSVLNSDFVGVGLFSRTDIYEGVQFDTVFNYQRGWNDISIAGNTGDFSTDSYNIAASLSKRHYYRPGWWLEPNVSISYSNLHRSAYTDSSGTAVPGSNVEQGRVTFGPVVGHVFAPGYDNIDQGEIFAGINGIYDFISNGDSSVGNGVVASYPSGGVQIIGGLNIVFDNGWNASTSMSYSSQGTLDSYSASLKLRIPLN
jgi:outer membrane autotransporter protein